MDYQKERAKVLLKFNLNFLLNVRNINKMAQRGLALLDFLKWVSAREAWPRMKMLDSNNYWLKKH